MVFLKILLLILKIMGIVILSVLGLILITVLTVLLVPLRYRGAGSYDSEADGDKLKFKAGASWLLHIVSFSYEYGISNPLKFKLFGFDLLNKKEKKKKNGRDKKKNKDKNDDKDKQKRKDKKAGKEESVPSGVSPEIVYIEDEPVPVSVRPGSEETTAGKADPKSDETTAGNADPKSDETTAGKADTESEAASSENSDDPQDSKKTTQDKGGYGKIKKYLDIIGTDEFRNTFELAKASLIKVLREILPRHLLIEADLGFDDPATLGSVLAVHGALYALIGKHVRIHPFWDRQIICVSGSFKGRVTAGRLLFIALRLYFNQNTRKLIRMFKEAQ